MRPAGSCVTSDRARTAPDDLGPEYMYDLALNPEIARGISTTWGYPGDVLQSPYGPNGDEVAVWDLERAQVVQTARLGEGAGATESDWLHEHATRYGYTIAANGLWLWEDEDADGFFDFHHVLDQLAVPCDMVLTPNDRYMFIADWFTDTVQQYDIDIYQARLVAEATVPHPCMMRLSPDAERLNVTNSVIAPLDDDPAFGPRNDQYGIWQFDVHRTRPGLTSVTHEGSAWVDFSSVHKQHGVGPAGPHMILFDPGVPIAPGAPLTRPLPRVRLSRPSSRGADPSRCPLLGLVVALRDGALSEDVGDAG